MSTTLRKIIAVLAILILILVAYYGSYLPLQKSRGFILAMRSLGPSPTLADFEKIFSRVLDTPSPIGQEELVRQVGSIVLNIVQQNNDPQAIKKVIALTDKYYEPIIRRNRGMSFSQNLYILGSINELAFLKTREPAYFNSAKNYFLKAVEFGPNRPQALYGAFDIFRLEGNIEGVKKTADKILEQWPSDEKTRALLAEFTKQADERQKDQAPK